MCPQLSQANNCRPNTEAEQTGDSGYSADLNKQVQPFGAVSGDQSEAKVLDPVLFTIRCVLPGFLLPKGLS